MLAVLGLEILVPVTRADSKRSIRYPWLSKARRPASQAAALLAATLRE